ncbi:MerR family transcriptional regulator [Thermoflavimicrobium daqui]|jgi:DNA-binding transcriptional MerR regulator|uniref:MerR family transcriptional regulator n=1 Tax=Thermoflavimicrobium daqui TaxID=2137476 RepID=A0A364K818_9BACL|nr:MerR family transcriptional regulator [Thermoflavimicrobium daqui]RAL26446.1 MerR family transcriptional regulator [Thermoflavimicrobium daqui]
MHQIEMVAKKTGLTKRTLRYYEEIGLITPSGRTEGRYRLYTDQDIEQILHMKNLRDLLGLSLNEIKNILLLEKKYHELRENYFQDKNSVALERQIELLNQLDHTLCTQQMMLQEKVKKMDKMIEEYDQKRKRIQAKLQELHDSKD